MATKRNRDYSRKYSPKVGEMKGGKPRRRHPKHYDKNEAKRRFLEALPGRTIHDAALYAGINRVTAYNWRKEDADFAAEWEATVEHDTDKIERRSVEIAYEGVLEPVIYQGVHMKDPETQKPMFIRKWPTHLMQFMLERRRPGVYSKTERHEIQATAGVLVVPAQISPEDWIQEQQKLNEERKPSGDE